MLLEDVVIGEGLYALALERSKGASVPGLARQDKTKPNPRWEGKTRIC
jgi:hypothetical protein